MAKIDRFEDIKAWQKARELVKIVYRLSTPATKLGKDFGLRDQIRKAAVSVMSNIAEGFARRGDKEFKRFLSIALGSTAEVQARSTLLWISDILRKKSSRNHMTLLWKPGS